MRELLTTLAEIAGFVSIAAGTFVLFGTGVALIAAGVLLVAAGVYGGRA